jgi:hypothetical protein
VDQQDPKESPFQAVTETTSRLESLRSRTQFGLGRMFLLISIITAAMAPLAYLAKGLRGDRQSLLIFMLFCLVGPPLVLISTSLLIRFAHWLIHRRTS